MYCSRILCFVILYVLQQKLVFCNIILLKLIENHKL
ncbi:hypothetical protein DCAR_0310939 [Daucus carota subsp. sativus]|uniref:Uncharacterized protein n=1 Tax=Daucus carota subsp. sativus TaxID=79200 RepID=A0AAF0WM76_DAUCS|nr:hypothetical protein DCAR_0310939 [Daucus carota subsp. sativus]